MPLRRWSGSVRITPDFYAFLILLLPFEAGSVLFDIGGGAINSILEHGFQTQTISMSCMKHGHAVTFRYFLNPISSESIQTRGRRKCSMLYATFIKAKARMQPPIGLLIPLSAWNPHCLPSTVARYDEHLLVAAAKRGDTHAFEELVNPYEAKIFRSTINTTHNPEHPHHATHP